MGDVVSNRSVWLARLLLVGGILETAAGLGLIIDPAGGASALVGSGLGASGALIGRIGGAGLLSLGMACWYARRTPAAPASLGVGWAYFAYNVVASAALAQAWVRVGRGAFPALAAALLHGTLGVAMLVTLLARGPASGPS